jgi:hypothetical protein
LHVLAGLSLERLDPRRLPAAGGNALLDRCCDRVTS